MLILCKRIYYMQAKAFARSADHVFHVCGFASRSGPFSLACPQVLMKSEPLSAEVIILWSSLPLVHIHTAGKVSHVHPLPLVRITLLMEWCRYFISDPHWFSKIWNSSLVCSRGHYSSYLAFRCQGAHRSSWQAEQLLLFLLRSVSRSSVIDWCWEGLVEWQTDTVAAFFCCMVAWQFQMIMHCTCGRFLMHLIFLNWLFCKASLGDVWWMRSERDHPAEPLWLWLYRH